MNVKEFVEKIKSGNQVQEVLQIKEYLPIEMKQVIAQAIIYDSIETVNDVQVMDSVKKHIALTRFMITEHTDLEYTDEDYDTLCMETVNGVTIMDLLFAAFYTDFKVCEKILGFMVEDWLRNNSLDVHLVGLVDKLSNAFGDVVGMVKDKIKDFNVEDFVPADTDKKQLSEFITKYIK